MTPEEIEYTKIIQRALQEGYTIHWYDLLALMIVGYWIGNVINGFLWFL